MAGRYQKETIFLNKNYRYGFNGKENDNEVKLDAEGNNLIGAQQDYGMRIYDPRVGRFLSVDPITAKYPELTPYQFSSNRPIDGVDQDGLERMDFKTHMSIYGGVGPGAGVGSYLFDWFTAGLFEMTDGYKDYAKNEIQNRTDAGYIENVPQNIRKISYNYNKLSADTKIVDGMMDWYANNQTLMTMAMDGVLGPIQSQLGNSLTRNVIIKRFTLAQKFYEKAGFDAAGALEHMKGIDFSKPVKTTTFDAGTILDQWTYLEKDGTPKIGNYYSVPGADPSKLGIPLEYRVKTQIILTKKTTFLQSTTSDIKDWTKGSTKMLKGGETQLLQTNVNLTLVP